MAIHFDPTVVLPYGAKVRIHYVDQFGLQGRDLHPTSADVGTSGVVYANVVEIQGTVDQNVAPGSPLPEDATVVYTIVTPEGRRLEVASWEVELIALP